MLCPPDRSIATFFQIHFLDHEKPIFQDLCRISCPRWTRPGRSGDQCSPPAHILGCRASRRGTNRTRVRESHSICRWVEDTGSPFSAWHRVGNASGLSARRPAGSGKTALFRYFRDSLPSSSLFSSSAGAIGLRVPKRPRPGLLVREFLRILKYPFAGGSYKQLYERRQLVFEALRSNGTRLVWLDEAHHLLPKHASRQIEHDETEATELLRELMDECKVSLVLAGSDELDNLKTIAPHFTTRVAGRAALGIFELDASWLGFLKAFSAQSLGFDIRLIEDRSLAKLLHFATGGNLRAFKQLILEAVLVAHDANELRLTQDHLRKAFDLVFGMACTRSNSFA